MKIVNSISFNMLADLKDQFQHQVISLEKAKEIAAAGLESAVGHADTAAVYGSQLGVEVQTDRVTLSLPKGETVLLGQLRGPRLPEGAKELPAGAIIEWLLVTIV